MTEKRFEDKLKTQIREFWPDSHTKKLATPYVGGILDLYTKVPFFPSMWIELKYHHFNSILSPDGKKLRPVKLDLSDLQRNFIRREHAAGGIAGWIIAVEWLHGRTIMVSGHDPDCQYITPDDLIRGESGDKFHRSRSQLECLFKRIVGTTSVAIKVPLQD